MVDDAALGISEAPGSPPARAPGPELPSWKTVTPLPSPDSRSPLRPPPTRGVTATLTPYRGSLSDSNSVAWPSRLGVGARTPLRDCWADAKPLPARSPSSGEDRDPPRFKLVVGGAEPPSTVPPSPARRESPMRPASAAGRSSQPLPPPPAGFRPEAEVGAFAVLQYACSYENLGVPSTVADALVAARSWLHALRRRDAELAEARRQLSIQESEAAGRAALIQTAASTIGELGRVFPGRWKRRAEMPLAPGLPGATDRSSGASMAGHPIVISGGVRSPKQARLH